MAKYKPELQAESGQAAVQEPTVSKAEVSQSEQDMIYTVKGGSILMFGRLVNTVSRFVITFVLARMLGAEDYGLYNLAITAATIAGAISVFGLDTTLTRYIAIMNVRHDKAGIWGVIQVGIGFSLLLSVLFATALFALAYPISISIFHEPRLAPLLQVASLVVPFLTLSDVLAGATRGFKNMADSVIAQNIVQPLLRLVLIVIAAVGGLSLPVTILIFGIADLAASLVLVYFLNRHFNLLRSLAQGKRNSREILGFSLPLWLSDLLTTFRSNIQTLLIGSLDSIRGVGIFSIANQVNLMSNIFHTSMSQTAKPLIAELNDQGAHKRIEQMYQTITRWVVTLNMPIILIIILFPSPIMGIFGKSFAAGAPALAIMGLVNFVNVATGMCGTVLDMTGHTRMKLANTIVRVSVGILANFMLIPRWGITGAAMAALIHEIVSNALPLVELWFLYRILPYSWAFLKPLTAGIVAAGVALFVRFRLPVSDDLISILLQMVVVVGVYLLVIQLLGLSTEERKMVNRLRRRAIGLFSAH
jgi:O-antigen/teichoic acid export membrane protein